MNSFWYSNKSLYLANSGIPLFTQSITYQVLLLIPIIAIEAYTHRKILKISIIKAIYISSVTNILSTLFGGILFFLLILQTNAVVDYSFPFLPLELIITLIPMFFISVFIESFTGGFMLKEIEGNKVKRSFLIANAFTYFMLVVLALTQLIKGYIEGQ